MTPLLSVCFNIISRIQLSIISGLYPHVAIADESNSSRKGSELIFHTKVTTPTYTETAPTYTNTAHTNTVLALQLGFIITLSCVIIVYFPFFFIE